MSEHISIRVINYNGDLDTLEEVNLIGPYESVEARDADIARLSALDEGMEIGYRLEPSTLDGGDWQHPPETFTSVTSEEEFVEALYS